MTPKVTEQRDNPHRDRACWLLTVHREGIDRFVRVGRTGKGEMGWQGHETLGDNIQPSHRSRMQNLFVRVETCDVHCTHVVLGLLHVLLLQYTDHIDAMVRFEQGNRERCFVNRKLFEML